MQTCEAIAKRRSIRKFRQIPVPRETLEYLCTIARLAPQGMNLQPVKFWVVDDPALVREVFLHCRFANAIRPIHDPAPGEEPVCYVVMLADTSIKKTDCEVDIASCAVTLQYAAMDFNVGSCWLIPNQPEEIRTLLGIPDHWLIHSLIALGEPAEQPVVEPMEHSVKYFQDECGRLHVPKRPPEEVIRFNKE